MRSLRSLFSDRLKSCSAGEQRRDPFSVSFLAISQYYITLEMSENKPNDEPKLSTTDRVVKCKCCVFFVCVFFFMPRYHKLPLSSRNEADLEEFTVASKQASKIDENCLLAMEEEGC